MTKYRSVPSIRSKLTTVPQLIQIIRRLQREGRRVVFTNGCFDILHPGHVQLLERAKRLGDVLIVAINSDRSVKALKGPRRPLLPQGARAIVVAALASVDYVTIFDELTPASLIERLRPEVLVKGADWTRHAIVGTDVVRRRGGRVVRIPLVDGYSTTRLINQIGRRRRR